MIRIKLDNVEIKYLKFVIKADLETAQDPDVLDIDDMVTGETLLAKIEELEEELAK